MINAEHSRTTDPAYAQCHNCGESKNYRHYPQAYYADAEDDPSTELLRALRAIWCRVCNNRIGYEGAVTSQDPGNPYGRRIRWEGCEGCSRARAAISHAQTAIDNARVLSCRKGWAAIQAAIMPEMQFEEARRDE